MTAKILLFIVSLFVIPFVDTGLLHKQEIPINYSEELSNHHVKAIIQDGNGFMWFGTKNRLNRFDGHNMRAYDCYDPQQGVRDNSINALVEDHAQQLWVGTDNGLFIFSMEKETFSLFDVATAEGIKIHQWISDIHLDQQHNVWITVPNQGVFRYNSIQRKLTLYKVVPEYKLGTQHPESLFVDAHGLVWVGSNGAGIFLYNAKKDTFEQFLDNTANQILKGKNIYSLQRYKDKLVLGIHQGALLLLNIQTKQLQEIVVPVVNTSVVRVVEVFDHTLWVGTQDGLFSVDIAAFERGTLTVNSHRLNDNYIEDIYRDQEGAIWIATKFAGVNYLSAFGSKFKVYKPQEKLNNAVSNRIKTIVESPNGDIWLGTEDSGILGFNPSTGTFRQLKTPSGNRQPATIIYNNGNLWSGYFGGSMDIFNPYTGVGRHQSIKDFGIEEGSIFVLYEDRAGNVWMGNGWEVFIRKPGETAWQRMPVFGNCFVQDIFQDSAGLIWFATMGSGSFSYDPVRGDVRQFLTGTGEGLPTNLLNGVAEDREGQIWFSTERAGISVYNKMSNTMKTYSVKEGLPDDIAYKIQVDSANNLWFGTNRGLVCFNPKDSRVRVFTTKDGLPSNSFNLNSAIVDRSGTFYMGTLDGLLAFKPDSFIKNTFVPTTFITQLQVSGKDVLPGSTDFPDINKGLPFLKRFKLRYDQNNITLFFAALSYAAPQANRYAYIMEGVDKDWVYTDHNHSASYANLQAGTYKFKVKGTNNDAVWGPERLVILEISPAWWGSDLAYAAYVFLFVAFGFYTVSALGKRQLRRQQARQRIFENQKERELYEAKINFFTDIAHEIRTPVSLINGPLTSILENGLAGARVQQNLQIMQRNGRLLMTLVDQLLDFRKVDAQRFMVNKTAVDVMDLLHNVLERFEIALQDKGIQLTVDTDLEGAFFVESDKEALSKIMNNMLSNAVKYGAHRIRIRCSVQAGAFQLSVLNDGLVISAEAQQKIFEPFFRVKDGNHQIPGSGLGLSLSLALAELLQATLTYKVEDGLNCFNLAIPMPATAAASLEQDGIELPFEAVHDGHSRHGEAIGALVLPKQDADKLAILLVEDNTDLLDFLSSELEGSFSIHTARDAEEAMHVMENQRFHMVLSDIMLNIMDGIALCQHIKGNPKLNHMIVILMTARNDLGSKLKALEAGADAYVEKPFSTRYLLALLDALIKNRNQVLSNVTKDPLFGIQTISLSKSDQLFLEKVIDSIQQHLMDTKFSVEKLAELLNYSRSSLHRRVKSISDYSPVELIRLVRMQRAVELLKQDEYRINEIAYLVGISSPSYFVKLFQAQFNMSPKEFKEAMKEK
ncbi:two-component regulator propeller domain-containing protein [Sphingobacterium sp. Mn56C]|uniref:two-component regulator propeller domain-containing protein n=1 Tax=Sphingobacterium sp. Mn56C TaxID=3395261 RepID=UPI003BBA4F53